MEKESLRFVKKLVSESGWIAYQKLSKRVLGWGWSKDSVTGHERIEITEKYYISSTKEDINENLFEKELDLEH